MMYLSSLLSLFSLGAGLDAVEAFEITVAGRAVVKITSLGGSDPPGAVAGVGSKTELLVPQRFSRDRDLTWGKLSGVFPFVLLALPKLPTLPMPLLRTLPSAAAFISCRKKK